MPSADILRSSPIVRTARVLQLEGLFDVPPSQRSEVRWRVDLPLDERPWNVGLIVGPSGSGKSTIARELFRDALFSGFQWPPDTSVVDAFPQTLGIKDITALLSSVGLSSPPAWLRPYSALSTGEQFRCTLARALAEMPALLVFDEFTSVVDRTVAKIGSCALAKTVRRREQRFIAVTCHEDVEDWLQPDWVFNPALQRFQWRELQRRPVIALRIERVPVDAWAMFRQHHYLSASLHRSARCFVASWCEIPVAFASVLPTIGLRGLWREHRTVCLPDYQGVGIGMSVSDTVASIARSATGGRYTSTTSHPSFVSSRKRSANWKLTRASGLVSPSGRKDRIAHATTRLTSSFEYVGAPWADQEEARSLWNDKP